MTVYGPLANTAVSLIAKFGANVTLKLRSATPTSSSQPWRGNTTETEVAPKGVVTTFDKKEIDGERILSTDLKLLVAAQDTTLTSFAPDLVVAAVIDSVRYGAEAYEKVKPGDTALIYTFRLRMG